MQQYRLVWIFIALLVFARGPGASAGDQLPALAADPAATSVSGISSGAYMAGQYEFAHAKEVVGAAIIAGGPFGCAEARYASFMLPASHLIMNASQSVTGCMLDNLTWYGIPDAAHLAGQARDLAEAGRIDPVSNLARHRIYLFSGLSDEIVKHSVVVAAAEVYLRLGIPKAQIKTGPALDAGHGFVTESEGASCERTAPPYVVHCGYDQAQDLLSHIYGQLRPKSAAATGQLITFDQSAFTGGLGDTGLATDGAVYVPAACANASGCRVHIAFHGCQQSRLDGGEAFVTSAGFERWADTNRLIVLFPQVAANPFTNPLGCWDWWGYTGFDYLTRDAPQISAVYRMVARLSAVRR